MSDPSVFSIGMSAGASDGGLERYYFELFAELERAGGEPRGLVVGRADGTCDCSPAVGTFARAGESMPRRWFRMRRVAPAYIRTADVVVSHFAPNAFPIADLLRKKPFVVHFHGPWALESQAEGSARWKTSIRSSIERAVYSGAGRFIVLSQAFGDILESSYGVAAERIRVVRGGVNLERFHALAPRLEARQRLGWPTDRPIVTTVRRLVPSKGVEHFIDAAVDVRRAVPDVLFKVLGTGPLLAELGRRVVERGLEKNVDLAGRVSDVDLALSYRASDLFVVPSIALEGFGLVVVEALASGTPALVTKVGGLPEAVRGLEPALILEGMGAEAIARGIVAALAEPARLPSEAACIAYAQKFNWKSVAAEVRAVYSEALANK